jgi:cation transport ATPase
MILGQLVERAVPMALRTWIELALASPTVIWAGRPLFARACQSIVNVTLNMFTLGGNRCGRGLWLQLVCGVISQGMTTLASAQDFQSIAGQGVTGRIEGHLVALGSKHMMDNLGILTDAVSHKADTERLDGHTVVFVAMESQLVGLIGVADPIKASTPEALRCSSRTAQKS